jgi:monoamine oxidase
MHLLGRGVASGVDQPLLAALTACCHDDRWSDARTTLLSYVEGFHAADPERVSARWLTEVEETEPPDASQHRAVAGLDWGIDALRANIDGRCRVRYRAIARHVRWEQSVVEVDADCAGTRETFTASALIVALPLAILKLDPGEPSVVHFSPPLEAKQSALRLLDTGSAVKITLVFYEPFWETLESLDDALFIQDFSKPVPTWWTTHPVVAPLLTGWVAGPAVARLGDIRGDALLDPALDSVASVLGVSRSTVQAQLRDWHWHDWSADPFARGAYSYVLSGGTEAHRVLSEPLSDTLFFAGEATCGGGHNATMDGALRSGRRAAKQLLSRAVT